MIIAGAGTLINTTTHTVSSFDKELQKLTQHILTMGNLVEELIGMALESLESADETLVKKAKSLYKKVSECDADVDKEATALLALWQPKAVDLRFVTSALKISSSLERMGDLAHNNVKRASHISSELQITLLSDFKEVSRIVTEMLNDALSALKESDIERADRVWMRDDEVDAIYKTLFDKIQISMQSNSAAIPSYMQIIFAAKNFERLGDYATKLAKSVHYIISGKRPKKHKVKAALAG